MTADTDYMDGTHLYLGVEAILTDEEKQKFLDRVYARNPHLRGAHVADIIDMLEASDSYLEVTEPLYQIHRAEIDAYYQPRLFDLCAYLAIYLKPDEVGIDGLAAWVWTDTRGYMDRWDANRCGHAWEEGGEVRSCTLDKGHTYPVDHCDRRAYYPYSRGD